MRHLSAVALISMLFLNCGIACGARTIHFVVHVPVDTLAGDAVYLAGSLPDVGGWKADGLKLIRQTDGTYVGDVALNVDETLEFKVTRGSWQTVEKSADGRDIPNRELAVNAETARVEITVQRWAAGGGHVTHTVVGTLKIQAVDSIALKQRRTIRVWLPAGYEADQNARLDVLYMHDGQNCFDRATSAFGNEWEIDETLTKLIAEKAIRPIIVVGIDNSPTDRIGEYSYAVDPKYGGGRGAAYARFVLDEVIPFVEKNYRVNTGQAHTFLAGSSLGGLISLEIARRHPDIFGGVIAMSPSIWWAGQSLTADVEKDAGGFAGTRIWIDMGTREEDETGSRAAAENKSFVDDIRRLDGALSKGLIEHHLMIDEGAHHNEQAWSKRFPAAIAYLLKP